MKQLGLLLFALTAIACSAESAGTSPILDCVDAGTCQPACDAGDAGCKPACDAGDAGCEPECAAGGCGPCANSGDCSLEEACKAGVCVPLTPCELGCSSGQHCNNDTHECVECIGNADCPSAQYCDPTQSSSCVDDACASGSSRCVGQAIETCLPSGSSWDIVAACPSDSVCAEVASQAWCQPVQCTPHERLCGGSGLFECGDSGTEWTLVEDCASSGGQCVASADGTTCVAPLCTPNARQCVDGDVVECDSLGLSYQPIQDCSDDHPCDPSTLQCKTQICVPNEVACTGNSVSACNSEGTGYADVTPCASDEACRDAACEKVVCLSNTYECAGTKILQCNASGTAQTEVTDCGSQYCVPGESKCRDKFCFPGETRCEGMTEAHCNADGTGYDSTTDCRAIDQVCLNGVCSEPVCEPGSYMCPPSGKSVWQCNVFGTGYRTNDTCNNAEVCIPGYPQCVAPICEANQPVCFGQIATVCNSSGDGYEAGTDCLAQDEVCKQGVCVARICEPSTRACISGAPVYCDAFGQIQTLLPCTSSQFCDPSDGLCYPRVCTPTSVGCVGTHLAACAADGSGYVASANDCASTPGMTCSGGQCVPVTCTQPLQCKDGNVYECVDGGGALKLKRQCNPQYHCVESDFTCAANVCPANQSTCDGRRATQCNSEGSAFTSGGTNCPAYCAAGACVTELFKDDFEDGDANGWTSTGPTSPSVNGSAAANSSSYGLELASSGSTVSTSRQFAESQPTHISWWQYVDNTSSTTISFDSTSYPGAPITISIDGRVVSFAYAAQASLTANTWHHFELRNMDWGSRVCDAYVDGVLRVVGYSLTAPFIGEFKFGASGTSTLKVDEIQLD
ncbi:MAG: hypothetical protein AB7K71_19870 [Polyangiaceae bacterium]